MTGPVVCYSDGGCSPNPGPGGWGVVILSPDGTVELRGGEPQSTNNRMEITAAVRALSWFPEGATVEVRTDSEYVVKSMTQWLASWKRNGWRTASKQPVKNAELFRELDALASRRRVTWRWVKGHAGEEHNERADALVAQGRREASGRPDESPRPAPPVVPTEPSGLAFVLPAELARSVTLRAEEAGIGVQAWIERTLAASPGHD